MKKTTLDELYIPLMSLPSIKKSQCAVCGRSYPLNNHHVVFRSQGEHYENGAKKEKPVITLCGIGNVLCDENGMLYCHGAAHHRMLHFRNNGGWEYLRTNTPMKYQEALKMDGWQRLGKKNRVPAIKQVSGYQELIPF